MKFLGNLMLLAIVFLMACNPARKEVEPSTKLPNIVIIYMDDLGQ
ncbi:MAG: hypothetical protein V2B15_20635 [Bacteroidota bacterium]